jgi:hypothetical protein
MCLNGVFVSGHVNENEVGPSLEKSKTGSLEIIPENCPLDPNGRLSISLDDQVSHAVSRNRGVEKNPFK